MTSFEYLVSAYVLLGVCVLICMYAWMTRHDEMTPMDWSLSRIDEDLDQVERGARA